MTKLLEEKELAEIRERDDRNFDQYSYSYLVDTYRDRRALLSHADALERQLAAVNMHADSVRDERDSLSQRLAAAESRVAELENAQLRAVGQMQVDLHEIVKLRGSLQLAERNAARYEWLRDHWDEPEVAKLHPWDEFSPDPDQLDAQIDAALSSQEQKCETPVECPECGGDVATGAHQLHCTLD